MATMAQVIDLAEARRRRRPPSESTATPSPSIPTMPLVWVPVWFMMPMWIPGPTYATAASL
jgi:hypothetical protein